jgi:dienelactone hydrolase
VLQHAPGNTGAAAAGADAGAAPTPVRFFVWRPAAPAPRDLPVMWFANGAYVEARWYSGLARRLAARGYAVVLSDYYRGPPAWAAAAGYAYTPPPGCAPPGGGVAGGAGGGGRGVLSSVALLRTFAAAAAAAPNGSLPVGRSSGGSERPWAGAGR